MRSTFKILFYINRQKIKKNGKCPIMGRITIDGKVVQYSAKEEIEPKFWNPKEGCCSGKGNECRRINLRLDELKREIGLSYQKDIERSGYVTADGIKNTIQGIGTNEVTLLKEFDLMKEEIKNGIGITHAQKTYYRYGNAYNVIRDFLKYKYGVDDVEFSRINKQFMEDYHFYLLTVRNFSTYSIQNYVRFLKHTIERAVNKEIIYRNPVRRFYADGRKSSRRWIPREDLNAILAKPHPVKNVNKVRNLFIFSVFTGLAYADIYNLKWSDIRTDKSGYKWIYKERTKTTTECHIPLLDIPLFIIENFKGKKNTDKVFDFFCYGTMNKHLTTLQEFYQFKTPLTFHQGRHSWATTICLSNGIPIETLSRTMGHRSIKTTQIYAEVTNMKMDEDMKLLETRIGSKYQLPGAEKKTEELLEFEKNNTEFRKLKLEEAI
ncbi:site-specific integrase [Dysgonomonas sp. 521]|uniref:site-specific integrase n=1 Tax=Dysgonomonas sp. 521 TaxID=2302932 RepID=UPI0013D1517C|nr:site-specific integrase [Dysgonomonas sp. 521]NDV94518.1 site-specific integrase [Dysgonomonas sp. 521]